MLLKVKAEGILQLKSGLFEQITRWLRFLSLAMSLSLSKSSVILVTASNSASKGFLIR